MDFHAGIICAAKRRSSQVSDSCGGGSNQDEFSLKFVWWETLLENVSDRVVRKSSPRSLIIDQHLPEGVGAQREHISEVDPHNADRAIEEIGVLRRSAHHRARGHNVERGI